MIFKSAFHLLGCGLLLGGGYTWWNWESLQWLTDTNWTMWLQRGLIWVLIGLVLLLCITGSIQAMTTRHSHAVNTVILVGSMLAVMALTYLFFWATLVMLLR